MLLTLGMNHKTAPIEVREKFAFTQENIPWLLNELNEEMLLDGVVLLSTCNRTEIYCSTLGGHGAWIEDMVSWWQAKLSLPLDIHRYLYTYADQGTVQHILRVASGLDSMVLGEPQILGQMKVAFRVANQVGVLGKKLSRLFQSSFMVAKRVRAFTGISRYPVSVAFSAVSLAKQIFSDFSQVTVMLIGAGENAELVLRHFLAKGVKRVIVVNRTFVRAQGLAERYGIECGRWEEWGNIVGQVDIVVSSVASEKPVLTQEKVRRALEGKKRRARLMIDLGVPRNIEGSVGEDEDIYLYSVDDLQGMVEQNKQYREGSVREAESIIVEAVDHYMRWVESQHQQEVVRALRQQAEGMKLSILAKGHRRLERGEDPKQVLEGALHQLMQKLMHAPTVGLREEGSSFSQEKIQFVKELFKVE